MALQPFYFAGLGRFFSALIYTQSVGLLGRVIRYINNVGDINSLPACQV
jgi:hypothetical protein